MTKLWSWFTSIFKSVWFKAFLMLATEKLKKILEQVVHAHSKRLVDFGFQLEALSPEIQELSIDGVP